MKISENIHALRIPFRINTPAGALERFVYSFVICGRDVCLIDTGVASSRETIFDYVSGMERKPDEISGVILTHAHPDHIGSVKDIKDTVGCRIMAHSADIAWIEDVDRQFAERPVPGFYSLVRGSVKVDTVLEEGDMIDLGGVKLKVIHTPGHSPGSISLHVEPDRVLIAGDAIPVPGDMPIYDDPLLLIESINKLKKINDVDVLLSSWDEPRTGTSISKVFDDGVDYITSIHNTAIDIGRTNPSMESGELCKKVLKIMGLPPYMDNPLVARSLAASLKYL